MQIFWLCSVWLQRFCCLKFTTLFFKYATYWFFSGMWPFKLQSMDQMLPSITNKNLDRWKNKLELSFYYFTLNLCSLSQNCSLTDFNFYIFWLGLVSNDQVTIDHPLTISDLVRQIQERGGQRCPFVHYCMTFWYLVSKKFHTHSVITRLWSL